jgi:CubicO group peptidase (beta-lactamase class C family)
VPIVMPPFSAAHAVLAEAIESHAFPGAAFGVLLHGEIQAVESVGRFTYAPDSSLVKPETIFDIASVSKVIATTAMAMLLYRRDQLNLDEPIVDHLPEFVRNAPFDSPRRQITARMLLAHSSGLPAYARLFETCRTSATLLDACLHMPLVALPEAQTVYSDLGFIILGHLLETLAGDSIDRYCQREIFRPLQMTSTQSCPLTAIRPSIPPTAIDSPIRRHILQGEVNDDNCFVLGGISGHAGIFSSAADILRFGACILRNGAPIFSPQTIATFTTTHRLPVAAQNLARALGWDIPSQPSCTGRYFSPHSVGHLGYTGTSLWIDLDKQLAITLLTNRSFPGDQSIDVAKQIQGVRPRFHDAVLRELGLGHF